MYPLHFYICLVASVTMVVAVILLAVYPVKLPVAPSNKMPTKVRTRAVRSPTRYPPPIITLDEDDDDNL